MACNSGRYKRRFCLEFTSVAEFPLRELRMNFSLNSSPTMIKKVLAYHSSNSPKNSKAPEAACFLSSYYLRSLRSRLFTSRIDVSMVYAGKKERD